MNVYLAIVFIALGILMEKGGRRLRESWRASKETFGYAVYEDSYYPERPFQGYRDVLNGMLSEAHGNMMARNDLTNEDEAQALTSYYAKSRVDECGTDRWHVETKEEQGD